MTVLSENEKATKNIAVNIQSDRKEIKKCYAIKVARKKGV